MLIARLVPEAPAEAIESLPAAPRSRKVRRLLNEKYYRAAADEAYAPGEYWEYLLNERFSLRGVGYPGLSVVKRSTVAST